MDTLSLYYFSELAKDLHITRTANRLFISQQTLSNHIMRLEEYYGVKLLNRKPSLSLTYAGEYVLSFAETMNRENANLMDILADIGLHKELRPFRQDKGLLMALLADMYENIPVIKKDKPSDLNITQKLLNISTIISPGN